jgi:hypothetical protein
MTKKEILKQSNHLHNIFLEDIAEASSITVSYDRNKNAIVKIVTYNTYHNAFFNNIENEISSIKRSVGVMHASQSDFNKSIKNFLIWFSGVAFLLTLIATMMQFNIISVSWFEKFTR